MIIENPNALKFVLQAELAKELLSGYSTGLQVPDWINRLINTYYDKMTAPPKEKDLENEEHVSPHVVQCDPSKHMEYVECKKKDGKVTWYCSFCHGKMEA